MGSDVPEELRAVVDAAWKRELAKKEMREHENEILRKRVADLEEAMEHARGCVRDKISELSSCHCPLCSPDLWPEIKPPAEATDADA